MNKKIGKLIIIFIWLFSLFTHVYAAEKPEIKKSSPQPCLSCSLSSDPNDAPNILHQVNSRTYKRNSLIDIPALVYLHKQVKKLTNKIDKMIGLELGLSIHHLFQALSTSLPKEPRAGTTTDMDFVGTEKLIHKGQPNQGQIFFQLEGRWDYGTVGPQLLGFNSIDSAIGTANSYSAYDPTFILRNLYWQQGSRTAGWAYRVGKITPDAILGSSKYINPNTTFLPNGGTGFFANALPDSGLGIAAVRFFNKKYSLGVLVSDANADRFNFGDIGKGKLYEAVEFAWRTIPAVKKGGFSKITLWHNAGNSSGTPINAMTGREGWGYSIKLEHDLSGNGNIIGILRYAKSFNDSAIYDQQAGAHLLIFRPFNISCITNDLLGIAFNWVQSSTAGARPEYNTEIFYRLPIFPFLDTTFSYQYVLHPALTRKINHVSVFSIRLTTSF